MIFFTKKTILLATITAIIFSVLGFIIGKFYFQNKDLQKQRLPIQSISNPIIGMQAAVEGTLVDKKNIATESSSPNLKGTYGKIVLENKGNKIEIDVGNEGLITQFYKAPPENRYINKDEIFFSDLQIGDYLEGGVSIDDSSDTEPVVYGHGFTVYPSKNKL